MERNDVRTNGPRPLTRRVLLIVLTAASLTNVCVFLPALRDMPELDVFALLGSEFSTEQFRSRAEIEKKKLDDWALRWDRFGRNLDLRTPAIPEDTHDGLMESRARHFTFETSWRVREYRNRLSLMCILPALWLLLLGLAWRLPRAAPYCALAAFVSLFSDPFLNGNLALWFTPYHLVTMLLMPALVVVEWRGREPTRARLPPPEPLWQKLREAGFTYLLGQGESVARRIDPPGLLSVLSLTGVTQKFWSYHHRNLLLFKIEGTEYLYVPKPGTGERAPQRPATTVMLTRLPVRARETNPVQRSLADRFAGCFALLEDAEVFAALPAHLAAKLDRFGPEIDLAPRLQDDLLRIVTRAEPREVVSLLALLDTVATFRGQGRDELDPADILLGEDAIRVLNAKLPGIPEKIRNALYKQAPGTETGRRLQRASAVVHKTTRIDGTSGGHRVSLVFVQLKVSADGWRYRRTILWSHYDEGAPLT